MVKFNLSWTRGRMLDRHGEIGYTYDRNGLRTAKHRGTVATRLRNYIYEGSKLVAERWVTQHAGNLERANYNHYQYDAAGLCGFTITRFDSDFHVGEVVSYYVGKISPKEPVLIEAFDWHGRIYEIGEVDDFSLLERDKKPPKNTMSCM